MHSNKLVDLFRITQVALALAFGLLGLTTVLFAGDGNRLYGCVTDASGRPVLRAKVIANRNNWFDKIWKVEVNRSSGCYEFKDLPHGTYLVYLEDNNYTGAWRSRQGPPQGNARFSFGGSAEVNLSTNFPDKNTLTAGLLRMFRSVPSGFQEIRDHEIIDKDEVFPYFLPPGYVAATIPGFRGCAIRYASDSSYSSAFHKCWMNNDMRGLDFAETFYKMMSEAITVTLGSRFPEFSPATKGDCKDGTEEGWRNCFEHTEWSSSNVFVDLRMFRYGKNQYRLDFTVTAVKLMKP